MHSKHYVWRLDLCLSFQAVRQFPTLKGFTIVLTGAVIYERGKISKTPGSAYHSHLTSAVLHQKLFLALPLAYLRDQVVIGVTLE
jgi:hypothetical protein